MDTVEISAQDVAVVVDDGMNEKQREIKRLAALHKEAQAEADRVVERMEQKRDKAKAALEAAEGYLKDAIKARKEIT